MRDERVDARTLSRLLDDDGGSVQGELEAIARVLRHAADTVRFDVPAAEVERALARTHAARRPTPRGRRAVVAVAVAVAALAAAALLIPYGSGPGTVQVQARALDALGSPAGVLRIVEVVRPGPGVGLPASVRRGWVDTSGGRQRWTQSALTGQVVSETLVDGGRVTRYDPSAGTAVAAASCRALASGCAEATDPIVFYRRTLAQAGSVAATATRAGGRPAYRFSLPLQRLPGTAPVRQVVTVDASTYLPVRIEWRQGPRLLATIDVRSVAPTPRGLEPAGALDLTLPPGTRITQLAATGAPVRALSTRPLSLARARALRPRPWWPGLRPLGRRLTGISLVRYTGGATALRLGYGPIVVWDYERTVPPSLLSTRIPLKQVPVGGGVGRIYADRGGVLVGEIDRPGGTVAVTAPALDAATMFALLGALRPL